MVEKSVLISNMFRSKGHNALTARLKWAVSQCRKQSGEQWSSKRFDLESWSPSRPAYLTATKCHSVKWCGGWDSNPRRPSPQDFSCSRILSQAPCSICERSCPF